MREQLFVRCTGKSASNFYSFFVSVVWCFFLLLLLFFPGFVYFFISVSLFISADFYFFIFLSSFLLSFVRFCVSKC